MNIKRYTHSTHTQQKPNPWTLLNFFHIIFQVLSTTGSAALTPMRRTSNGNTLCIFNSYIRLMLACASPSMPRNITQLKEQIFSVYSKEKRRSKLQTVQNVACETKCYKVKVEKRKLSSLRLSSHSLSYMPFPLLGFDSMHSSNELCCAA